MIRRDEAKKIVNEWMQGNPSALPATLRTALKNSHLEYLLNGPASRRLEKSKSPLTRDFWKKYDSEFVNAEIENIKAHIDIYRQAKATNHPHVKALEKWDYSFNESVHVPELSRILDRVEAGLVYRIVTGERELGDTMFPQLTVLEGKFEGFPWTPKVVHLPFGAEIHAAIDVIPHPLKNLGVDSTVKNFSQLVADGIFPVGPTFDVNFGRMGHISTTAHDLSHQTVLEDKPHKLVNDYLRALKQANQYVAENGIEIPLTGATKWTNPGTKAFFASETMAAVHPDKLNSLHQYILLPSDVSKNTVLTKNDLASELRKLSPEEFHAHVEKLKREVWDYIVPLGGAERDLITFMAFDDPTQYPLHDKLARLNSFEPGEAIQIWHIAYVADFQYFVWKLSELDPVQMVHALYGMSVPQQQKIEVFLQYLYPGNDL